MALLRFVAVALLALAFAGLSTHTGRTQRATATGSMQTNEIPKAADESRVIYSLTDMGYDAELGKWIAETIPLMVEPNSWVGYRGMIRYYAPKNILLVKQTSAIQQKVEGFLKDLKASMPKASVRNSAAKKTPPAAVVPADYREPALLRASSPASETSPYPVPAAVKPPKHLFHFIIRYEGDGIIDDNVVKFMKAQLQGAKSPVSVVPGAGAYVPCAPPVPPPAVSETPVPSAYAPPATPYGGSAPSAEPVQPSPAPKKKKEKKVGQKPSVVETR